MQPPKKGEEFDPFAPNPVGFRWFKGVTLFTAAVSRIPDRGVYLAVFKVGRTHHGRACYACAHHPSPTHELPRPLPSGHLPDHSVQ